jgi:3-deoxy-7-phosphoheptulonate synthase
VLSCLMTVRKIRSSTNFRCKSSCLFQAHKFSVLLMSLIILHGSRLPVVRIMRIAGQYAKPRSKPTEIVDGKEVLSFRGDNVNGYDVDDRKPDPQRLLGAYFHSTATLNYIRTLLSSGFADLHKPLDWSFSHVRSSELQEAFTSVIDSLKDSLDFMKVATGGAGGNDRGGSETVDLFTSHEALLLDYEEALTRSFTSSFSPPISRSSSRARLDDASLSPTRPAKSTDGKHYNVSSHFIWIGDRTRQLDGAHVEYFRGIANPM